MVAVIVSVSELVLDVTGDVELTDVEVSVDVVSEVVDGSTSLASVVATDPKSAGFTDSNGSGEECGLPPADAVDGTPEG